MNLLLALALACSGPPAGSGQPLPAQVNLTAVELYSLAPGLVLRAASAQTPGDEPTRGQASEVVAELGSPPGLSISSAQASWDLRGHHVVFEGDVVAIRGGFTLRCQRLEATFDNPEQLSRATASGEVSVRHRDRLATGQRAVLDVAVGRLVLDGEPAVVEGGRSLRGERIVLFLDDERLECERCSLSIDQPSLSAPTAASDASP